MKDHTLYTVVVGEPTELNKSVSEYTRQIIGRPLMSSRVPTNDINVAHQLMQECRARNLKWTYLVKEMDEV